MLNMLTDASFKSRLAKVTYVPAGEEKDQFTKYGLLIEDESDMAKRNGGRIFTLRGGTFADMDPTANGLVSVFAYFLGNTDWSLYSLHNIRLVTGGGATCRFRTTSTGQGPCSRDTRSPTRAWASDGAGSSVPRTVLHAGRAGAGHGEVRRAEGRDSWRSTRNCRWKMATVGGATRLQ